jgi:hypothetical protein
MEPRAYEKPLESGNAKQNFVLPPKEGKRRFQMVRLEERVAPATTLCTTGCQTQHTAV